MIPTNKKNKNASITTFTLVAIFLFLLKGWTHRHLSALGGVFIWTLVCFSELEDDKRRENENNNVI